MAISRQTFHDYLTKKVLIIDGAMGTLIESAGLTASDYAGYEGCPEILNVSRPDLIESIHKNYLKAGANILETNTFGANALVLKEYGLEKRTYELNIEGAKRARKVVDSFKDSTTYHFVAGSIGPGTRLPSLNQVTPAEIYEGYKPQIQGLIDGGVDLLIVETAQDLLHVKTLIRLILEWAEEIPLIVSATIESNGTMLAGSDIPTLVTVLSPFPLSALGLNCATGPKHMKIYLQQLAEISPFPLFAMPNAGLPVHKEGHFVYELTPEKMAEDIKPFVTDIHASIVGGCCGSTPDHIRSICHKVQHINPIPFTEKKREPAVSSLFQRQIIRVKPAPLIISERANATGSRAFKNALLREDWDTMVLFVNQQEDEGAHVVDVSLSVVGRDEAKDMECFIRRLNAECRLPLQLDSTSDEVLEKALQHTGGRSIVNSANLENGEEAFCKKVHLCKTYGAMLICLTIDEQGMAKTTERKVTIAERMISLAEKGGLHPDDLFVDPLTFTLASGEEADRNAAVETLQAIKILKKKFPAVHLLLGVSNVSFGLKPSLRHVLNSVMLYEAVQAGIHAAIIHPEKIVPLSTLPQSIVSLCQDLIYNKTQKGDPLLKLIQETEPLLYPEILDKEEQKTPEDILKWKLLHGDSSKLESLLTSLREKMSPLDIVNKILLPAMKEIGDLFGSGKMQLPFVLKSAAVMKKAVDILKPYMEKSKVVQRGTVILATVKGDVHDIGKNLVDIILSNNGYLVHNLGIKQTPEAICEAVQTLKPDAVGLSGLLVRSTQEMKNTLIALRENNISIPVILGGAALTESFVHTELKPAYSGNVFYAEDAFQGLAILNALSENSLRDETISSNKIKKKDFSPKKPLQKSSIKPYHYPSPPFEDVHIRENVTIETLKQFINLKTLFTFQWQLRKGKMTDEEYQTFLQQEGNMRFETMIQNPEIRTSFEPKVAYGYFFVHKTSENDVAVKMSKSHKRIILTFPRQQKEEGLSVADYFLPDEEGLLPIQCVTMGAAAIRYSQMLYHSGDYAEYFFYHGLLMQLTEALAEENHAFIRYELGLDTTKESTFKKPGQYQGIRISPGYPMAPPLEYQKDILQLLNASKIGVSLTSGYQLVPECSTTALILLHPDAKYFKI